MSRKLNPSYLCDLCGADALYLRNDEYRCHACNIGEYNAEVGRWVRSTREEEITRDFITNVMPAWNRVPETLELTIFSGDADRNTERWIGTQLGKLSKRGGKRAYQSRGAYTTIKDMWYTVITASYGGQNPKLMAFFEMDINEERKKAHIQWFVSARAVVDGKNVSIGSLLILTALYLALSRGVTVVKLVALNDEVGAIYRKYGFEYDKEPDMRIENLQRAANEFYYETQLQNFIGNLNAVLQNDDQRRQFYDTIETSLSRISSNSLKSEAIWHYASYVMQEFTDHYRFKSGLITKKMFELQWNVGSIVEPTVENSPFSRAVDAFYFGYDTMKFEEVYNQFRRITASIDRRMNDDQSKDLRVVIVLPAKIRDRNFFASLLFVAIVSEARWSSKIRFLNLGQPSVFRKQFKPRRNLIYYHPIDLCVSDESDLPWLRNEFAEIERINAQMGRPKLSYQICCTAAYATKKVVQLCTSRGITMFNPHIVPTTRDLLETHGLIQPHERQFDDSRIVAVSDYVDARKLPTLAFPDKMFYKVRDVLLPRGTYDSTIRDLDLLESQTYNHVRTELPVLDLPALIIEALTTKKSSLLYVEPTLDDTDNVYSFIASIDPETLGMYEFDE